MRSTLALVVTLLLAAPAAGALVVPGARLVPPLPSDITDAEVLMLLAPHWGATPTRLPVPQPEPGMDVATMAARLGTRAGMQLGDADVAPFGELHPLVAAPVLTMLVAIDQAWRLRDAAFADWTEAELRAAHEASLADAPQPRVLTPDEKENLVNAAIMLSDTIESIVIPQLNAAADAGVWPPIAVADPVGVLRIGSSGDDVETIDRILQIDAQGDDAYYNNAGGTTVARDLDPTTPDFPIAISLDLAGDDLYQRTLGPGQGGTTMGIGLLYETRGHDTFLCGRLCHGGADLGVAIFRDLEGDDVSAEAAGLGYANAALGYARDDSGDDDRLADYAAGGYGSNRGLALYWDQGGADEYSGFVSFDLWGYSDFPLADAWFVDEGPDTDTWRERSNGDPTPPHLCNNCEWTGGVAGVGNDNSGGLAYVFSRNT